MFESSSSGEFLDGPQVSDRGRREPGAPGRLLLLDVRCVCGVDGWGWLWLRFGAGRYFGLTRRLARPVTDARLRRRGRSRLFWGAEGSGFLGLRARLELGLG